MQFSITAKQMGDILLRGKSINIQSPAEAISQGIAYVPEDRRQHGVILDMAIRANITLASLSRLAGHLSLDFRREREIAADYTRRFAIKTPSLDTPVGNLSGGNQQKVALARWLATRPSVLIWTNQHRGSTLEQNRKFTH